MHTTTSAEEVRTGTRQRKEFKSSELQDLANSILRVGLIHAIVVEQDTRILIAGERRLRALARIKEPFRYGDEWFTYPHIPVHLIQRDDPKLIFELELEENLRRVNLTPMEEAQALTQLHNVRRMENPAQTIKATAEEISRLRPSELKTATKMEEQNLAEAILIDQFKDDPEVISAAKVSMRRAAKVAKKKMELDIARALSGTIDIPASGLFQLYPGSAEEILPSFPKESFDILLFDPPYGVDADKFGEQAMDLGHQYEDTKVYALDFLNMVLRESKNFLKPNAHVLMFCAFEHFYKWKTLYEQQDFLVWPRPLIWSKGYQAHVPVPDYGPRYSYECILFAARGRRKINKLINDVLIFPAVRDKIHAAEKPADLLGELLDFVAQPGDRVLDPCIGSGSLFQGAKGKEIYITGVEKDPNYYAIAKERAR